MKKTLEEVDQFKYPGSIQTKYVTLTKEEKIRLALAHSAVTRLTIEWENNASVFQQSLNSTSHLSCHERFMDLRPGRWWWICKGKSRRLKTNAAADCLAYEQPYSIFRIPRSTTGDRTKYVASSSGLNAIEVMTLSKDAN